MKYQIKYNVHGVYTQEEVTTIDADSIEEALEAFCYGGEQGEREIIGNEWHSDTEISEGGDLYVKAADAPEDDYIRMDWKYE